MGRKEQIKYEALKRYPIQHPFLDISKESFIEGAKWADEITKKELINKACEWMECIDFEMEYQYTDNDGYSFFDADKFIEDFRKAMEE